MPINKADGFTLRSNGGKLFELKLQCNVSPAAQLVIGKPAPPSIAMTGLWDTGATRTAITKAVADKLGLVPITQVKSYHAGGEDIVNVYLINIGLPNGVFFEFVQVTEAKLTGTDVLIGMDIITTGDFSITNVNNNTVFSFRVPSQKEIDYVQTINKEREREINPKSHSNHTPAKKKRKR